MNTLSCPAPGINSHPHCPPPGKMAFYASERSRITCWTATRQQTMTTYLNLLLPVLGWKSRHNEQRWITWIAPDFLEKKVLQGFDVDLSVLRIIVDGQRQHSSYRLLLSALRNQRSSLVIASLPQLNELEKMELEQAAAEGECEGIILVQE